MLSEIPLDPLCIFQKNAEVFDEHNVTVSIVCSDANLIVPFLLASIEKDELIELVNACRNEAGFTQNDRFWENTSIPLIIEWAKNEVERFKQEKTK